MVRISGIEKNWELTCERTTGSREGTYQNDVGRRSSSRKTLKDPGGAGESNTESCPVNCYSRGYGNQRPPRGSADTLQSPSFRAQWVELRRTLAPELPPAISPRPPAPPLNPARLFSNRGSSRDPGSASSPRQHTLVEKAKRPPSLGGSAAPGRSCLLKGPASYRGGREQ